MAQHNACRDGVVGGWPGGRVRHDGRPLLGRLLLIDLLEAETTTVAVERDAACPVCGDAPTITELIDYEAFCGVSTGSSK